MQDAVLFSVAELSRFGQPQPAIHVAALAALHRHAGFDSAFAANGWGCFIGPSSAVRALSGVVRTCARAVCLPVTLMSLRCRSPGHVRRTFSVDRPSSVRQRRTALRETWPGRAASPVTHGEQRACPRSEQPLCCLQGSDSSICYPQHCRSPLIYRGADGHRRSNFDSNSPEPGICRDRDRTRAASVPAGHGRHKSAPFH